MKSSVDDEMEEGKAITSIAGVERDRSFPSSTIDVDMKPNMSSNREPSDIPSTSAGATTMLIIPSVQTEKSKPV